MDAAEFTQRAKAVWGMGEYDPIAQRLAPVARILADECAISAGQEILDVAAGTGNLAAVAASEGAAVIATDLAPAMVERGRARTAAEGFDVEWREGDAQDLPFEDASFDCVASVFGAVFAPDPEAVARELFRVVRPGNTVGLTAWTPESFAAQMFRRYRDYLPAPDFPAPELWAVEDTARERLEPYAGTLQYERRILTMTADSVDELTAVFQDAPAGAAAKQALDQAVWNELEARVREQVAEANQAEDGSCSIPFEYAVIVARKRG